MDDRTRDGALAFMQYLNAPASSAAAHRTGGFLPISDASARLLAAEGWFDERPYHAVPYDQLLDPRRYGRGSPVSSPAAQGARFGNFAQIEDVMAAAMDDVLVDGADPLGRFTQATADAQELLLAYNTQHAPPG